MGELWEKQCLLKPERKGRAGELFPSVLSPSMRWLHVMEFREAEASVMEVRVSLVALVVKNPSANAEDA